MRGSFTGDPHLDDIVQRELRYNQTRWTEVWVSCIMVCFGAILLNDDVTFNNSGYAVIRNYVSEDVAGLISMVTGIIRLLALYVNGSYKRTPLIRVAGCIGGFLFFMALAYGLFLTAPPLSTGIATYGLIAVAELHSSSRAARDAFAYDSLGTRKRRRERAAGNTELHRVGG